jgi:predicted ATPase
VIMIQKIKIENFKSLQSLTVELGRVNVLIGENGSGKSNILEAIAMGSAAAENKLGNEFLSTRGIRTTDPKAMRSGFQKENAEQNIKIEFSDEEDISSEFDLSNKHRSSSSWVNTGRVNFSNKITEQIKEVFSGKKTVSEFQKELGIPHDAEVEEINESLNVLKFILSISTVENTKMVALTTSNIVNSFAGIQYSTFKNFLIYAPENYFLRRFEDEGQIQPLGIRGEGLFKLIAELQENNPEQFEKIKNHLELIDWFGGFEVPNNLKFTERRISIKDRFLDDGLGYFDQRSSNEGFLFLLFYFSLFVSDYTPRFFAIDNIDNSLNPKLCAELVKILVKLAKEHNKQVILTTHNPAILDGLNLNDDEQRLFVVYRNAEGHTKTKRVLPKSLPEGSTPVKLSEQFLRGYIGGLPNNF